MASSISPLSSLDPSVYQSLTPSLSSKPAGAGGAVPAMAEFQAMRQQGDQQSYFNDSLAAGLLQPADGTSSATAANALVNNMLLELLGAYQTQGTSSNGSGKPAFG